MQKTIERVCQQMADEDIDLIVVSPSPDMQYLIGIPGHLSERPMLLAFGPQVQPILLTPALEQEGLSSVGGVDLVPYDETSDPLAVFVAKLGSDRFSRIAICDQMWAGFVLRLQVVMPAAQYLPASSVLRELRMRKTVEEIQLLGQAAQKVDAAFASLVTLQFSGRSEREIAEDLSSLLREHGLDAANWGPIVGSGPHSASPHHTPDDRIVQSGDAVVLDFGGVFRGYQADITRTVVVGEPSARFRGVYEVVRQGQEAAVQAVQVGRTAQAIDTVARNIIDSAGFGDWFIHRTGHGIGLDTHEEPYIVAGNALELEEGMTFSIEPGVYMPGEFGVRIEDIVAVTESGGRRLNGAPRDLVTVS